MFVGVYVCVCGLKVCVCVDVTIYGNECAEVWVWVQWYVCLAL